MKMLDALPSPALLFAYKFRCMHYFAYFAYFEETI